MERISNGSAFALSAVLERPLSQQIQAQSMRERIFSAVSSIYRLLTTRQILVGVSVLAVVLIVAKRFFANKPQLEAFHDALKSCLNSIGPLSKKYESKYYSSAPCEKDNMICTDKYLEISPDEKLRYFQDILSSFTNLQTLLEKPLPLVIDAKITGKLKLIIDDVKKQIDILQANGTPLSTEAQKDERIFKTVDAWMRAIGEIYRDLLSQLP